METSEDTFFVSELELTIDGEQQSVPEGMTAAEHYANRRDVVVAKINGELVVLDTPLEENATVEAVTISSPDGLDVLRHSAAHVLAQAVQETFQDARLGIGPPIADGFYYDFDVAEAFTPEEDRKSTRLNSSHVSISYAAFCL